MPKVWLCLLVSIDATQRRCGRTSTTVYRLFVFEDEGNICVKTIVFRLCIQNGKISSWEYCLPIEHDWALHLIIGVHSSAYRSGSIWKYLSSNIPFFLVEVVVRLHGSGRSGLRAKRRSQRCDAREPGKGEFLARQFCWHFDVVWLLRHLQSDKKLWFFLFLFPCIIICRVAAVEGAEDEVEEARAGWAVLGHHDDDYDYVAFSQHLHHLCCQHIDHTDQLHHQQHHLNHHYGRAGVVLVEWWEKMCPGTSGPVSDFVISGGFENIPRIVNVVLSHNLLWGKGLIALLALERVINFFNERYYAPPSPFEPPNWRIGKLHNMPPKNHLDVRDNLWNIWIFNYLTLIKCNSNSD